jgi:hypothetical protein
MPKYSELILIVLFIANYISFNLLAQGRHGLLEITHKKIRLISDDGDYRLQITEHDTNIYLSIPLNWLIPEEPEENGYVSSINYDSTVTVFDIGGGLSAIHISSYDIQQEGSAQAAAGRDVFLVYSEQQNRVFSGLIDLGITKDRVRSGGTFYATNSHFVLGDINRDGFTDIGVLKEELEFSPCSQSCIMHPVDWYVFEHNSWIQRADSSGIFPARGVTRLPLIGLSRNPVDYVKEISLHKNVCLLKYEDFGVQAMAYELIGYQWYQWKPHGDPDPDTRYDIKVIVYKDIPAGMVREFYTVYKELRQDYRYVEYCRALHYLNKQIREIEELQKTESHQGDVSLFTDLKSTLLKTRDKIVRRLND